MRLLVVEDSSKMASLLRRGLTEEGYAVDVVANGVDAVWSATEESFDAIVLDVVLPDIDGFEVCRRLRHAGRWAPIVMLTARDDVSDRVERERSADLLVLGGEIAVEYVDDMGMSNVHGRGTA